MWRRLRNSIHFRYWVVVEHVEIFVTGWCLCVGVCVWCPSLRCGFASRSNREVYVSLYDAHPTDILGRNWYAFLTAERNSYVHLTAVGCNGSSVAVNWRITRFKQRMKIFGVFSQCLPERTSVVLPFRFLVFFLWHNSPTRSKATSLLRFLVHTQLETHKTTPGRSPVHV